MVCRCISVYLNLGLERCAGGQVPRRLWSLGQWEAGRGPTHSGKKRLDPPKLQVRLARIAVGNTRLTVR